VLRFHVAAADGGPVHGMVVIEDATDDRRVLDAVVDRPVWPLSVPRHWPSSLYRATFTPGGEAVYFVVRPDEPGRTAPVLVSIPFATWQAYSRSGVPYEGLYYAEQPDRAVRISFDRPGGGPPPERWEDGMLRWLRPAGYPVEYCSNLDLHDGLDLLRAYRLLVVNGHDEYWSIQMRDAVEAFARSGGNVAFFAGNTCFWQARFEDDMRTMVCYRDAVTDPMTHVDPGRVTVEWSSAPVHRPENSLTGVSYRRGAGAWGDYMDAMKEAEYTVRFADHWVFAGTGVSDGDRFGLGAVGYETDAADFEEIDGVPRATGRDGTPPSFVILATADLRHWRRFGQGGYATMGIFRLGAGTVFNAATVNWGNTLDDPVVERVTRNVLDRLSGRQPPPGWEVIGPPADLVALAACGQRLFAVDGHGGLLSREAGGQNLRWAPVDDAAGVICLTAPREAVAGLALGLYAVTVDGVLCYRDAVTTRAAWTELCPAPDGTAAIGIADGTLYAVTGTDELWYLPFVRLAGGERAWTRIGPAGGTIALTGMSGRLYAIDRTGRVRTRPPVPVPVDWVDLVDAAGCTMLAGHAGRLVGTAPGRHLYWLDALTR
jgi:hypothetical protein